MLHPWDARGEEKTPSNDLSPQLRPDVLQLEDCYNHCTLFSSDFNFFNCFFTWDKVGFLISDEERHHRYFFMLEEYRVGVLAFPDFLRYSINSVKCLNLKCVAQGVITQVTTV